MKEKVTIAIPTYNRKDLLQEAIQSCQEQTYGEIEIVISDNCSDDGTDEMVKSVQDSRIIYFRHPNPVPPIDNWNKCIELATGEYFSYMTDDDLISPVYIESLLKIMHENNGKAMVRCLIQAIDLKGQPIRYMDDRLPATATVKEYVIADLYKTIFHTMGAVLCSTQLLKKVGGFEPVGFPGGIYTDSYLWLKVVLNCSEVITLQEYLYYWRVHSTHLDIGLDFQKIADNAANYVKKYGDLNVESLLDKDDVNYIVNDYARDIIKLHYGTKLGQMIQGQTPYSRKTILTYFSILKSHAGMRRLGLLNIVRTALLLINKHLASFVSRIYRLLFYK